MSIKFIQANVNKSKPSMDLLLHFSKECAADMLLISEPNYVPSTDNWYTSLDRKAAIFIDPNRARERCEIAHIGSKFVAINYGAYLVISIYASPSLDLITFNSLLDELSETISHRTNKIIIGGDFNAKAGLWGMKFTDKKGLNLTRWAAERDLRIVNCGDRPTCVRPQGSSIVDLTWISPDLGRFIRNWKVEENIESLSDHLYISYELSLKNLPSASKKPLSRLWNHKKFDEDLFNAVLFWRGFGPVNNDTPSKFVSWIDLVLTEACDVASKRIGPKKPKRTAYWWNDTAAVIRKECFRARRRWQSAKRKNIKSLDIKKLGEEYKQKRKELRKEINRLKTTAWEELIDSIEKDPWGLPYKVVLKKLKTASISLTEKLEENTLDDLLESLFPRNNRLEKLEDWSGFEWNEEWEISSDEVDVVIRKVSASSNKAPGPDGFRKVILKKINCEFLEWVRYTYNLCLKMGEFPEDWKCANLVLIPKADSLENNQTPKARPICLINEIAKGFERIIANRIHVWQIEHPESGLSENQYGFRKSRSTCDAILRLLEITTDATKNGEYAIVVGVDIKNAFNSIPWRVIKRAMIKMGFPPYIRRIVNSYLSSRTVRYVGKGGIPRGKEMTAGVPQGSVLGPVLWNIAFDSVLSLANTDEHCNILCYADDTLIVVTGKDIVHTKLRAETFVTRVKNYIQKLGLTIAENKTEAMLFSPKKKAAPIAGLTVAGREICFSPSMKYLGVQVDNKWNFSEHFKLIERKVDNIVKALNKLMPNLRGPNENKRKLYGNVVLSVMLYGAPVWGDSLGSSNKLGNLVSLQRSLAQRIISSYRSVSGDVACMLARLPPIKFLAPMRKKIYIRIKEHQIGDTLSKQIRDTIREEEHQIMLERWKGFLERPNSPGVFTKLFLVPRLEDWMARSFGELTFHVSQILTGHGCFSKFLYKIGRRANSMCDLCGEEIDDVLHVLRECPVWDPERMRMRRVLGIERRFNMSDIVDSILESREKWFSFSAFVEKAMRDKEEEERKRERTSEASQPVVDPDSDW